MGSTPLERMAAIAANLQRDGQRVWTWNTPVGQAAVGYRQDFKLRWMATKIHLMTIALPVESVTGDGLNRFARTELVRKFAAFAWPVAVEAPTDRTVYHQGRVWLGGIYAGWMRRGIRVALGLPTHG